MIEVQILCKFPSLQIYFLLLLQEVPIQEDKTEELEDNDNYQLLEEQINTEEVVSAYQSHPNKPSKKLRTTVNLQQSDTLKPPANKNVIMQSSTSTIQEAINALQNVSEQYAMATRTPTDCYDQFGKIIAEYLRQMTMSNVLKCQKQILDIVLNNLMTQQLSAVNEHLPNQSFSVENNVDLSNNQSSSFFSSNSFSSSTTTSFPSSSTVPFNSSTIVPVEFIENDNLENKD